MDELTLMRSFGAERVKRNPTTRALARRALEARFDSPPPSAPAIAAPGRRRGLLSRRRRVLAFAAATAVATVVAGILVLGSGPTAQPAAAEVLRQTAAVAADAPSVFPGPGQFLYERMKAVELQEWIPGSFTASYGGVIPRPNSSFDPDDAFDAFIPWQEEVWMSAREPSRHRSVLETPRFLTGAEKSRWETAGAPLPGLFEGASRHEPGLHVIEMRRGVRDVEGMDGPGFRDFPNLPTEPKALRLAIERRQTAAAPNYGGAEATSLDVPRVISELWDILDKPNTTPPLRAAVFGALAELPGIALDRDAKDLVGRSGYALSYQKPSSSDSEYQLPGIRVEYVFDPETSAILGRREVVVDPARLPLAKRPPAGTVRREVAYLESGIVDSTRERPGERDGEPVATTDPSYRK